MQEKYYNYTSFLSRFKMPYGASDGNLNFWWSMDFNNAHFVFFSTEHPYNPGSPQYEWLENDLVLADQNRALRPW
jgi:hypothetical protein